MQAASKGRSLAENPSLEAPLNARIQPYLRASLRALGCLSIAAAALVGCEGEPASKTGAPEQPSTSLTPVSPRLRRLLARQYTSAIADLLGATAASAADPPADAPLNGFDAIGASQLSLSDGAVAQLEASARAVAAAAMGDKAQVDALLGCASTGPSDAACHTSFVKRFGRRAFRRTLDEDEVARYVALAQTQSIENSDFYAGVETLIATMLQAPSFLYEAALGEDVPGSDPPVRRLTGVEFATRMSFFLLDTIPDEAALDAAEAGALDTTEGVREAALSLLSRPEARAATGELFGEIYRIREVSGVVKDATAFPSFSPALAEAMKQESLRVIDDLVWVKDADMRDLFTTEETFVNAETAALYGAEAPANPSDFIQVSLPEEQGRAGLLGHASVLSLMAHATVTSPTLRGKFIRERILCQSIPPPPPGVVTTLPAATEALTMRERLADHDTDPSCSGCHAKMDGIGLALESFDAIGRHRATDQGHALDLSGEIDGLGTFDGARELGALLHESPLVTECMVRQVYRHALAHVETQGEEDAVAALSSAFGSSGYKLRDLLVEIVVSDAFRVVGSVE